MTDVSVIGLGSMGTAPARAQLAAGRPVRVDRTVDLPAANIMTCAFALRDVLARFECPDARGAVPRLIVDMADKDMDAGLGDNAPMALMPLLAEKGET